MNTKPVIEKFERVQKVRNELEAMQEEIYNDDFYYEENEREIYETIIDLHRAVIQYLVELQKLYQSATNEEERSKIA